MIFDEHMNTYRVPGITIVYMLGTKNSQRDSKQSSVLAGKSTSSSSATTAVGWRMDGQDGGGGYAKRTDSEPISTR